MSEVVERGGFLFVLDPWEPMFDEPIERRLAWPTGIRAADYPEWVGQACEYQGSGICRLASGQLFRLESNGQTRADHRHGECRAISPPRGKKLHRWYLGRWERV